MAVVSLIRKFHFGRPSRLIIAQPAHEGESVRKKHRWACLSLTMFLALVATTRWAFPQAVEKPRALSNLRVSSEGDIYVDWRNGSDSYVGTLGLPFKTITKGVQTAQAKNKQGIPANVRLAPGVYRESISWISNGPESSIPISIVGSVKGAVTISGSDVWVDWQPDRQNPNLFSHRWPYKWGLCPVPSRWPPVQDIVRRREMIFVNGKLLKQVLAFGEMREGSFFVDELNARVYIWVPPGTNMQTAIVEVAVRPELLRFQGKSNLTLRGLTFVHANSCLSRSAVTISGGSNNLVEDSDFIWNNWIGFGDFGASFNSTLRKVVANHNGGAGMTGHALNSAVYEDIQVSENNWRGALGNFYGWAVAGMKLAGIHGGSFTRIKAIGNHTRGIWFDFDNRDIVVDQLFTAQNKCDGIFLEASQGPITIRNGRICANGTEGVLISNSSWVKLNANIIYGNKKSQILVSGELEGRKVEDRETHAEYTLLAENWTISQNVIMGLSSTAALIGTNQTARNWSTFLTSLTSDQNTWHSPNVESAFQLNVNDYGGSPKFVNFASWKRATGQDKNSVFGRPAIDPATACAAPQ